MSERLTIFLKAVNDFADEKCSEIEYKAQSYKDENITSYYKQAEQKTNDYIEYETSRMRNTVNSKISQYESEKKSALISLRSTITEKVFDEVKENISAFTKTNDYGAFLIKSAKELKASVGEEIIIFMRTEDISFADSIKEAVNCEIKEDNEIILGGLRATDKNGLIMADDTLDIRLAEAQKEFVSKSDLKIF